AVLRRALDDLVVYVGDVAHIGDAVAARPQPAPDQVERHHHAAVPDVAVVVDRHAANVHAHLSRTDRHEVLLVPGERVVNAEHGRWGGRTPAASCVNPSCEAAGLSLE